MSRRKVKYYININTHSTILNKEFKIKLMFLIKRLAYQFDPEHYLQFNMRFKQQIA